MSLFSRVLAIRLFMPSMVVVVGGTADCGDCGDNRNVRLSLIMKLPDQSRPDQL